MSVKATFPAAEKISSLRCSLYTRPTEKKNKNSDLFPSMELQMLEIRNEIGHFHCIVITLKASFHFAPPLLKEKKITF